MRKIIFNIVALLSFVVVVALCFAMLCAWSNPTSISVFGRTVLIDARGYIDLLDGGLNVVGAVSPTAYVPVLVLCGIIVIAWLTGARARLSGSRENLDATDFGSGENASRITNYWKHAPLVARILFVLTLLFVAIWIYSYLDSFARTTKSGLESVILYHGQLTLEVRSQPGANYGDAAGPGHGFGLLWTGAFATPTRQNGRIWTIFAPLWLFTFACCIIPAKTFLALRRAEARRRRIAND